ncbi:SusD/RagB family nutrient-binding outer membrane lipoprotein [Maribacter sp. PR1]|uniref:SusD/RagB family nutrient-binding outer membrane lipoprotein n=1 Tax=Maribacter cobaltidurans TaxID=1178778 RepID=A0ABU7INS1_9FLAO|nr:MULTISPECIES: SusD/RagB family nutrient-binding outer membrane lipoprotein [Maribacter]MDC6387222.1 SusD/RagB family nutrient-binding outer membrane lipoprotein [Maribacter sp. PR1]MEE1974607.1 SusD/RagB family nutrient-binding outer membrane lipoprotein [Maribacter cobaltidurans]
MLKKYQQTINKGLGVLALAFGLNACESTELQILDSPNALTPAQADADLFLNSIEVGLGIFFDGDARGLTTIGVSEEGAEVTRMLHMFGPTYTNAYPPSDFDTAWEQAYSEVLADVRAIEPIAEEAQLYTHIGISKTIEAYIVMTLVDYFGEIPYSEALLGAENTNPTLDDDAAIYAAVETLLDEAITQFNRDELNGAPSDIFYGGDESKWINLANTLKLKLYLQTRLVDSSVGGKINALLSEGNLILSEADDFAYQYSATNANPDSRHPLFTRNFNVPADVADYMSNSYMVRVKDEYLGRDPRTRYYFYRQSLDFTEDPNEAECITQPRPTSYSPSDVFCDPGGGYWGRDHGDNDGIPPDGGLRSTWGVYPVGGLFDDSRGEAVSGRFIGLQGAGISPIMLSSFTNFMLAEGALTAGVNGDARAYLEAGIRASITKVIGFGERLDYLDDVVIADDPDTAEDESLTVRDLYVPTTEDVDSYVDTVLSAYDSASGDDRLEIVVNEYMKALWGNGVEAYNTYRRTGFPSDMQPTYLSNPGDYINSFLYPNELVNQNSNAEQKASQAERVFWAEGGPTLE